MADKTRIAVLGIGSVGGYFGGLLADHYHDSEQVEIIFIARPGSEKIIKERGLKIISPHWEKVVFPHMVSSDPGKVGIVDFLICSVKSYDLEESISSVATCVGPETIILPLLNGVDARERISAILPNTEVWEGLVYIVARLTEPGLITETGNIHSLYFGAKSAQKEKLQKLESIFSRAGLDSYLSWNIEEAVWEKFLFISTIASLTSYLNLPIGTIFEDQTHVELLKQLLAELRSIALAKKIKLPEDIIEKSLAKMKKLPYETTSSMHSDFQKGGKTEYRSLTEYVVKLGEQLGIETPVYSKVLSKLSTEK